MLVWNQNILFNHIYRFCVLQALVDLLKSPSAFSLQDLKFNNNGLGGGGIILAETLIQCHARSVEAGKPLRLKTFVAGRNRLVLVIISMF